VKTRGLAIAVLALATWSGAASAFAPQSAAAPAAEPAGRVLVMPFDNIKREGRIFWMSEASAVLLSDNLQALGVDAIPRDERHRALQRLQVPHIASLTDATIIRIGQLVGAAAVVVGSLQLEGDTLSVRARSIALDTGRVQVNIAESGPLPQLFATFERIARRLAPASNRTPEDILKLHPPVAAFEDYIKGLLAATPATAISYLKAALAVQPSFDRARLALWDIHTEQADHQQALAAVQPVPAGSPLARAARFRGGLSQISLKRYDDAFATFRTLADADPVATVMNNLGVVQILRGATPQSGQPTYFFTDAADSDPGDPDYFFNLGYAYWLEHDMQAAIYWLREALRRDPTDGEAHYVLGAALAAGGASSGESAREKELARRLSSTFEAWDKRPAADPIPKGLERLKADIDVPRRSATFATEQRDQMQLVQFYLERGRRLYEQDNDRDAVVELNRALFLSPYQAEAQLLLGRIRLRSGQVQEAIDALKISLWSAETVEAHVTLGEAYLQLGDLAAARQEAERALVMDPKARAAQQLLDRTGPRE
jgi:tetratricopeptide (TPR) repeat protein